MSYALKQDRPKQISPEEYLRLEKAADTKSEYIDGQIYAMAGARPRHNKIATDLTRLLGNRLESMGCEVYNSDQRVREEGRRGYFYPDISVVCGEEDFDTDDCLLNPVALFEVLSESTEQKDRVAKWLFYQQIPSLRIYVLISQEQLLVEIYERAEETSDWIYRSFTHSDDLVRLDALQIEIPVAEIYRRVTFSELTG